MMVSSKRASPTRPFQLSCAWMHRLSHAALTAGNAAMAVVEKIGWIDRSIRVTLSLAWLGSANLTSSES